MEAVKPALRHAVKVSVLESTERSLFVEDFTSHPKGFDISEWRESVMVKELKRPL